MQDIFLSSMEDFNEECGRQAQAMWWGVVFLQNELVSAVKRALN